MFLFFVLASFRAGLLVGRLLMLLPLPPLLLLWEGKGEGGRWTRNKKWKHVEESSPLRPESPLGVLLPECKKVFLAVGIHYCSRLFHRNALALSITVVYPVLVNHWRRRCEIGSGKRGRGADGAEEHVEESSPLRPESPLGVLLPECKKVFLAVGIHYFSRRFHRNALALSITVVSPVLVNHWRRRCEIWGGKRGRGAEGAEGRTSE